MIKFNHVTRRTATLADSVANKLNDRVKRFDDKLAAKQEEEAWATHEEKQDRLDNAGR
jgi:hypothetical protein